MRLVHLSWTDVAVSPVVLTHERGLLERIERTFQDTQTLRARFRQINQDGTVQTGTVALRRPG